MNPKSNGGGGGGPTSFDINIVASKIVCNSESDLPNWGPGGPDITAATANEFLNSHPNCHLESGWKFQWANEGAPNPGPTFVGEASGWNTFGSTNQQGVATTTISVTSATSYVWAREVLKDNYLSFTYSDDNNPNNDNSYSAEMYCHTDVLNYDNNDMVNSPFISGGTYYCVAFNALKTTPHINTPPTITLVGANPLNLTVGQTFTDPGATANDAEDGNLTSSIVVTGSVDTSAVSTTTLVYTVTDSGGLSASTTRQVIVNSAATTTPPIITPPVTPPSGGGSALGGSHRHEVVVGEILGATSCMYLRDYLKIDWQNDPIEVLKLQSFLNVFEKENLSLTGVYDQTTFDAVARFQTKYSEDILIPWGDKVTKGFTYILTKKKVNEIYCNSLFPVTQDQQNEIDTFRTTGVNVSGGVGQSSEGSSQGQNISIKDINSEAVSIPVIELVSSSSNDSMIRNAAISLFALSPKIFGDSNNCNYTSILLFLVLIALIITIVKLFIGSKNSSNTPIAPKSPTTKEPPIIILPGTLPDEEIIIENPDEEELISTPDLRDDHDEHKKFN